MKPFHRRQFFSAGLAAATAASQTAGAQTPQPHKGAPLDIADYQPKSMLEVPSHQVSRARYPVIDVHTHLTSSGKDEVLHYSASPEELLEVMSRRNLQTLVNLTGGVGSGPVKECATRYDRAHPGRFVSFTQPWFSRANEPGYARMQGDEMERAKAAGARGLKVLKTLGLYLRDDKGKLVAIDDRRFDPMWEACGALGLPVAIHISDPLAFFTPIDRFNERFEELNNHPDWSFHGKDFPANAELIEARNRVFARHPKTTFIALHVGHFAENLANVSDALDRFPNMNVEIGARIGELGRQPRTARKFFDRYQDRILFGTDAVPKGYSTPQQVYGDELYQIYFRFLETEDEYFDYAPAPVPPQGRWKIYGIGLPDPVLRKVYNANASRLLML
jgi:hypothetical protein